MMGEGLARPIGPNTHALSPLSASSAPRPYMASFSCDPADGGGVIAVNPGGVATPAFCAKYNQVSETEGARRTARVFFGNGAGFSSVVSHSLFLSSPPPQRYCDCRLLALADEEGCLSVVETGGAALPLALYAEAGAGAASAAGVSAPRPRAQWLCHNNAVFDLAWARVSAWRVGGWRESERGMRRCAGVRACLPAWVWRWDGWRG